MQSQAELSLAIINNSICNITKMDNIVPSMAAIIHLINGYVEYCMLHTDTIKNPQVAPHSPDTLPYFFKLLTTLTTDEQKKIVERISLHTHLFLLTDENYQSFMKYYTNETLSSNTFLITNLNNILGAYLPFSYYLNQYLYGGLNTTEEYTTFKLIETQLPLLAIPFIHALNEFITQCITLHQISSREIQTILSTYSLLQFIFDIDKLPVVIQNTINKNITDTTLQILNRTRIP